ncbi:MAG: class 1 fructose-bisphosphatase [Deltaproteobacteria bacterium]|nr:class 1 fructose-bisphosphatase [Deltaproteobacteria bacterium]|tara:strand:- start:93 stop:1088 length:996 start_codon:yes stop_codon:yes gene_type:complete
MLRQFEEGTTLDRFIFETTKSHADATGQFATLLKQVSLAARLVSSRVNRAGLAGMLGGTGEMNVQGEFVQKLDIYANDTFKSALEHPGVCCAICSEEDEEATLTPDRFHSGKYVFCMDPLDGSSNIDVNATIGTIFGIFSRKSEEGTPATKEDILQTGSEVVAAGYIVYGSGTVLVLAVDGQVNGFTLDPVVGEFFLSHPDIRLAPNALTYSTNEAYAYSWEPKLRDYIDGLKQSGQGWRARYIGSLVADFHRNLIKGGIFLYPATKKAPEGKLRLMYEAFPLAYIVETAGGAATNGHQRILDIEPESVHARTPLFIGNAENVADLEAALA